MPIKFKRKISESLFIRQLKPTLNVDEKSIPPFFHSNYTERYFSQLLTLIIKRITVAALVAFCIALNTEFGKIWIAYFHFVFKLFVNIASMHILNTLFLPDDVIWISGKILYLFLNFK